MGRGHSLIQWFKTRPASDDEHDVTSPSTTVAREFSGHLVVGDETIPAALWFLNNKVSLEVAGEPIGAWPTSEVDLVPADDGVDVRAEGDSVRFLPDRPDDLVSFLGGEANPPIKTDTLDSAISELGPVEEGAGIDPAELRTPEFLSAEPEEASTSNADFEGLFESLDVTPPEDPPGLAFADTPDPFYAAGYQGPELETGTRSPIRTPLSRPQAETPPSVEPMATQESAFANGSELQLIDPPTVEARKSPPVEMSAPPAPAEEETGITPQPEPESDRPASKISLSGLLAPRRNQPSDETIEGTEDLPEPMSDRENLRQWALVAAGGAIVTVIIGLVVWGLVSLLGNRQTETPAVEAVATTEAAPPPTMATTTTSPQPSTTVSPENQAMAAAFVSSWNELAREYAYHLAIAGDSLPLSTAPAATVHLTYDEDGVLVLSMAPKGTGTDRDILVAMGLAVAWADPSLGPDGRRDLLSTLGVDVDAPDLADMGGELARNGVQYSLEVLDGIIRMRVVPSGA